MLQQRSTLETVPTVKPRAICKTRHSHRERVRATLQTTKLSYSVSKHLNVPPNEGIFNSLSAVTVLSGTLIAAGLNAGFKRLFRRGSRPRRVLTKMHSGEVAEFSIATFNLRGIMDRWSERRNVLQRCLKEIDADVLCFQECLTGEYAQDRSMLSPEYHVFPCKAALFNLLSSGNGFLHWYARTVSNLLTFGPARHIMVCLPLAIESVRERFSLHGAFFRALRDFAIAPFFGNSVACRLVDAHEIKHSTLVLGDWRAVQRIEFELGDNNQSYNHHAVHGTDSKDGSTAKFKVWVVNTHLDHEHPDNRQRQAMEVARWMESARREAAAVVLCGDFNGPPDEPFHQFLRSLGYKSGYSLHHGREPHGTWPTGIKAPLMDHGPFECLDYVYVWAAPGYAVRVMDAQVFGDRPDPKDSTLFPSDHAAVKVTLQLERWQPGRGSEINGRGEILGRKDKAVKT